MSITRLDLQSDATWSRAWVIDTLAELAAFALLYSTPLGPKRGDVVLCVEDNRFYIFLGNNVYKPISGLAVLPIDLVNDVTNTLEVIHGGTGLNLASQGDLLYGSAVNTLSRLGKDTAATRYLSNKGTSNNPTWSQITLTDGVTGVLPVANGGTGISSLTANRIPYGNGSSPFQSDADLTFDGSTLTLNGLLDIAGSSAGQIKFPATQNPSSDANTLDDYEEGTWTPVLGGTGGATGVTYSAQNGRYVKVGRFIDCQFDIELSNKGTITGDLQIEGLPFSTPNVVPGGAPQPLLFALLFTVWNTVYALPVQNTSVALIRGSALAATNNVTSLTATDLNNNSVFVGSLLYLTSQ